MDEERAPWFAALREKAGDGSTDCFELIRQSDLTRLLDLVEDEYARLGRHVCGQDQTESQRQAAAHAREGTPHSLLRRRERRGY